MSEDENDLEELEIVTLTDEDGVETEFAIIDTVEHNSSEYMLAVEAALIDDEDSEAVIFKKSSDDDEVYEIIEDDDEFNQIAELFQASNGDYEIDLQ